jgi:uncharacterized integral membrane protein (TIGR00697 family)
VNLDARLKLFITLVAVFMVCLVVGDMIGGKLAGFELFGREWVFSVGQVAFPVTFILTDILNEFYGKRVVRGITILAFLMVALTLVIVTVADALPWASFTLSPGWAEGGGNVTPEAFERVFTQARWIQVCSMLAFLIGNLTDITVFFLIKKATGNRFLWLRATGSTAVSQLIDTIIITSLLFGEKVPFGTLVTMIATSYAIKLTAAIGVTPIIYLLHEVIERRFGIRPADPETQATELPEAGIRD